jgi:mevalonate kinase
METNRNFCAKILLFGEYSVICNSMGLTMPYDRYSGRFRKAGTPSEEQQKSIENLKGFYHYLKQLDEKSELPASLDLKAFKKELEEGLYFASDIPQGYGVGSSGALCAAVFDRFALNGRNGELSELKKIFARMESWFHGTSSGLDPLISYLNKPLLIRNKETLEIMKKPEGLLSDYVKTFLVDTGKTGETGHLVQMFMDKCREPRFDEEIKNTLIPLNNSCIEKYTKVDMSAFIPEVKQLSAFFLKYFKPMIPEHFQQFWEEGTKESAPYTLKLCGSGGGGFLLGFTTDFEAAKARFSGYDLFEVGAA